MGRLGAGGAAQSEDVPQLNKNINDNNICIIQQCHTMYIQQCHTMYIHPAMSYNVYTSSNKCIKVLVSLQYGAIRDNDLAISPYYVIYTYVYMYICIHIHNMYYIDGTRPEGAKPPRASALYPHTYLSDVM